MVSINQHVNIGIHTFLTINRLCSNMSYILCCPNDQAYKSQILGHESEFRQFLSWGRYPKQSSVGGTVEMTDNTHVVQVIRQINYGLLEFKRYFLKTNSGTFVEVDEKWLINAKFQKQNA